METDQVREHLKEKDRADAYFTLLLEKAIGVSLIPYNDTFCFYKSIRTGIRGDARAALQQMGIDPNNTVVLIDHHAATYPAEIDLASSGFDQLSLYPIDPCCIGRRANVDTFRSRCKIEPAVVSDRYIQQIFEELRQRMST